MPRSFASPTRDMLVDWIKRHKDLSNRRSAIIFCKFNSRLGYEVESVRKMIGFIRLPVKVKNVSKNGNVIYNHPDKYKDLIRSKEEIDSWRNHIPQATRNTYKEYEIPTSVHKVLWIGDIHAKYHDERALWTIIKAGKQQGCDTVALAGDAIDCADLSNFTKEPLAETVGAEFEAIAKILCEINRYMKPSLIIYKQGNHEQRIQRYVMNRSPGTFGLMGKFKDWLSIPSGEYDDDGMEKRTALESMGINVKIVAPNTPIRHKNLTFYHGQEFGKTFGVPVNPAAWLMRKTKASAVCFHFHKDSQHSERSALGELITCWSVGCACNLHPEYRTNNDWVHGFAILTTSKTKYWEFKNYRIIDGKVV